MKKLLLLTCTTLMAMPSLGATQSAVPAGKTAVELSRADDITMPANVEMEEASPFLEALMSAYNTNPRLKAEREGLKAVDEGVAEALSGFRPSAAVNVSKGRQRARTNGDWDYQNSRSRSASISQPIFRGGQTIYGYQSAKQRVKAARADLRQIEQQVLLDAVSAYSDVYEKQSVLALNQNNADVLSKQLEATQARFDVGELTRTDVAQAQARHAQAIADLQQAQGNLKTAKASFKRIIGYEPQNLLPDSVTPALPNTLDDAISTAEQMNPALLAAMHAKKANRYGVDQAKGVILPEISLDGSASRSRGSGFINQFDNDALLLNVTVPLYQSGAEYARVRKAHNVHQQSKYIELDIKNQVIEGVTRAYEDYQTALSVIQSTTSAVDAADIAREGVREENQFGVRTILDVLDAEQELFRTRVNLVRAERSKILQAYGLLASIGKLSAGDLGLPVTRYDPTKHYDDVKWLPIGF